MTDSIAESCGARGHHPTTLSTPEPSSPNPTTEQPNLLNGFLYEWLSPFCDGPGSAPPVISRLQRAFWRASCGLLAAACLTEAAAGADKLVEIVELESGVKAISEKGCSWPAAGKGCRVARTELDDSAQWRVRVDGKPVASYDDVARFLFSADGSAYAYMTRRRPRDFFVINGEEEPAFRQLYAFVFFSPDSKRVAYLARTDGRFLIVVDGVEGKARFEGVIGYFGVDRSGKIQPSSERGGPLQRGGLIFSPDSRRVAFVADMGDPAKQFVIVDDQRQQEYPGVTRPSFSPDGKHLAYAAFAEDRKTMLVSVDGAERERYDAVVVPPVYRDDGILEFIALKGESLIKVQVKDSAAWRAMKQPQPHAP